MGAERARAIYRRFLWLAPDTLRTRHAREMEDLFVEALGEARARGRMSVIHVWIAASWDLLRATFRRTPSAASFERRPSMLGTDLRYSLRWLARQRGSTVLVATMLSLGIGANVVVFSLVNGLFLRPFPFPEADRLVYINETAPRWNLDITGINFPDYYRWSQDARLFNGIALFEPTSFNLSDGTHAERISGAAVTADFATVLRLEPLVGRTFTNDEDRPKAARVTVIGEALWRERFGAAADVVGRTLKLNGVSHTTVGVMPRAAEFPGEVKIWVPSAGDPNQTQQSYGAEGIGRLKAGVSADDATRDLLRAHEPIWNARDKQKIVSPFARPLREQFVQDFRASAAALLVAVALLLLVTCANVASILLARALARRREMAIRLAVGASRVRLVRQLFVENVILAAVGGAAGLALGRWALVMLLRRAEDQVPPWANFAFDVRIAAFAIGIAVATALLFGLAPALHAVRSSVRAAISDAGTGSTAGPGGRRTLSWLVGAEFALAAVLLVCGGLLFRAYDRVRHVDPGFRPEHVLTFALALPEATYPDDAKRLAFWNRLTQRLSEKSGVEAAGMVTCLPLGCHWGTFYQIEGRTPLAPGESNPVTLYRPASPGYFAAMGIRLKAGRWFDDRDRADSNRVIIVNETFVRTFWPGIVDPVGRRIRSGEKSPWMTVVGVVADVRHYGLERPMRPGLYIPIAQNPTTTGSVAVRTAADPETFTATARAVLREIDPELPLYRVRTMEEAIARSLSRRTLYSWLLGVFASLAFLLALGGTYGVTSYLVTQRTREIGIRLALGARTAHITRGVLRASLSVVGAGLVAGLAGSVGIARYLSSLLFGVPPQDGTVLSAAVAILLGTATVANWIPARRAARIDPMRSVRCE